MVIGVKLGGCSLLLAMVSVLVCVEHEQLLVRHCCGVSQTAVRHLIQQQLVHGIDGRLHPLIRSWSSLKEILRFYS